MCRNSMPEARTQAIASAIKFTLAIRGSSVTIAAHAERASEAY